MALSYGFFNSLNGDRKYDAEQMSRIFDGIINDGVFDSVGNMFAVSPGSGMGIKVAPGRAWFNSTWTYNDADLPLTLADADVTMGRYDAVVLEVNSNNSVRANSIKVITGAPSETPEKPVMTNADGVYQHPLAYILVGAGETEVRAAAIENAVGTSECPFVTGILKTANIDALFSEWNGQFLEWLANLQSQLKGDVAGNLQAQINDILKPATKSLFGLPFSAGPDDAFAFLGKFNQHWWSKSKNDERKFIKVQAEITSSKSLTGRFIYWSEAIEIDQVTGDVILVNPTAVKSFSVSCATELVSHAPCYIACSNGAVYFLPKGSTGGGNSGYSDFAPYTLTYYYDGDDDGTTEWMKVIAAPKKGSIAELVTTIVAPTEYTSEYLKSNEREAYPDSGSTEKIIRVNGNSSNVSIYSTSTIQYSDKVEIVDGKVDLAGNIKTIKMSWGKNTMTNYNSLLPDTFDTFHNKFFKITSSSTLKDTVLYWPWSGYVQTTSSASRDGYPEVISGLKTIGIFDAGYEYKYLGIPVEQIISGARIYCGTYIGTGVYGANNPNRLVLPFIPQIVYVNGMNVMVQYTRANKTNVVEWYNTSDTGQYNVQGTVYTYLAIG